MKVYPDQLDGQLRRELGPAYVLSGDEPLQLMEAADAVRRAGRLRGFLGREVFSAEAGFEWGQFRAACDAYALFGEPRILDVRLAGKPDRPGAEALLHFAEQPPDDAILLLSLPRLSASDQKARWFQALERRGVVVQVWPLEGDKLLRWLDRRLNARGLLADQSGLRLLAARVEGNLLAAAQEIEKLHILHGSGRLSDEQILQSVADSARYDVFDLADQVLRGRLGKAARILAGLKGEGVAAPVVLWALTRELRLLNQLKSELLRGIPAETVFSQHRLWDSRKAALSQALQRLELPTIRTALVLAARADRIMKGAELGEDWDALLQLCELLSHPGAVGHPAFSTTTCH